MKVLFICTGNTCRSPMAQAMFRKLLQEKQVEDILCQSAGISAANGMPATENAVTACGEIGIDLSGHRSRRITKEEVENWDVFFAMTRTHGYILMEAGIPQEKIYIARPEISDPFGRDLTVYRTCRDEIDCALRIFLERIQAAHANSEHL